jgi:hypothetical protein
MNNMMFLQPVSIVSYNHLGNNDGKNLSAPKQFRSKEISKSNVVDDMVESNRVLYDEGEKPDHCVVIKYVPYVADSKRAMDEYTSEIFMNGLNTIVMHNTCEVRTVKLDQSLISHGGEGWDGVAKRRLANIIFVTFISTIDSFNKMLINF